jgi:hypothetical protein
MLGCARRQSRAINLLDRLDAKCHNRPAMSDSAAQKFPRPSAKPGPPEEAARASRRWPSKTMSNAAAFNAALHALDTENRTFGCRNPNPELCANRDNPKVCSRVRADHICWGPPTIWTKQFKKLKAK